MTDQLAPVAIGNQLVGPNQPVYMIGEIGINHNGDVEIAKQLMDVAVTAGAQAVKFQKRNPDVAVPEHQKSKMRDTPWGEMTYLDYKWRVEFGKDEYAEIDRYAKEVGLQWFASPWDTDSVDFLENEFDARDIQGGLGIADGLRASARDRRHRQARPVLLRHVGLGDAGQGRRGLRP